MVGRAVPRDGRSIRGGVFRRDGRDSRVFTSRGRIFNNYYYYYPRRLYPFGYGAFGGLGYFYYDPFTWYAHDPYLSRPYYYGAYPYYGGGYYGGGSSYDTGELRLQIVPRHAEVYVDGYFAGHVDNFDGTFQALRLEEGPYKIEVVAPGYEPLEFDIRILRGRKITYRGELRPRP
ncbi:MAG: PEGA domain-containing protein [Vicinamibacterales bacterium]